MALPPRLTFSIFEVAARWGCAANDIAEWALSGHLELSATIPMATAAGLDVSGLMAIHPAEVAALFRRDGGGEQIIRIRRVRQRRTDTAWQMITDPEDGISVSRYDIVITTDEIEKFETENGLTPPAGNYKGKSALWDWDAFWAALTMRIHEHGLPEKQADLVNEMTAWFERRSDDGSAPDISTIRKKVALVWREMQAA